MSAFGVTFREANFNMRAAMGYPVPCCTQVDVATFGRQLVDTVCGCSHCPNFECPCVVPPPPPPPSFWDQVVGIPIDAWLAAKSSDDVRALIAQRDRRAA